MPHSAADASTNGGQPMKRANGLLLVPDTPKGRGIFASQFIKKGTVVDVSPVLIFADDEVDRHIRHTCLFHYTYYWPSPDANSTSSSSSSTTTTQTQAMALGLGSMFNHSRYRQNVVWTRHFEDQCITYIACRDIQPGEELCISYGNARLWFDDAEGEDEDDEYRQIERTRRGDANGNGNGEVAEIGISGLGHIEL